METAGDFSVAIARFAETRDRLYSSFAIVADRALESRRRFVTEFEGVSLTTEPFPLVASKKGLQVQMLDDALELGVKHAAFNVNLAGMIDVVAEPDSLQSEMDGETYWFKARFFENLDAKVKAFSEAGGVVTLILLNYEGSDERLNAITLHPGYDRACPNRLSAFNTMTADGLRHFKAGMEFLAERYSRADRRQGRAVNFVVGNEVNSHWFWSNLGRVSMEAMAADYLRSVRIAHTAIRKFSAAARVYLSLEHHWNIRYAGGDEQQTFPGRPFLERFNSLAEAGGNFDWHVAFHPYPENLGDCRTWNDRTAILSDDTPRITFRNLEMLPRFLRRPEFLFAGASRRIILSEQGFHTDDAPDGELQQAAAFAYAYYRAQAIPEIDSLILHRHVDHREEGGLKLGLWRRNEQSARASEPGEKKMIHEVFRRADTTEWEKAFEFALPVVGIQSWEEVRPRPEDEVFSPRPDGKGATKAPPPDS